MSFASKLKTYVDNAPTAGFVNTNFGRLTTEVLVAKWTGKKGEPRAKTTKPYAEDYELSDGESLELKFVVHISELNPKLEFEYERSVAIKNSGTIKADWEETVLPSLVEVFGDNWAEILVDTKKKVFVAVEDVPQLSGKTSQSGKVYTVPKFIASYKNLEECKAARDAKYGNSENADEETDGASSIPDSVLEQVQGLYKTVGNSLPKLTKMLDNKPFGEYDTADLIAATGIK